MQDMRSARKRPNAGFTIVEMLVVAPIMVIVVVVFIGLIISYTGDALLRRTASEVAYDTQHALIKIEQDGSLAIDFPQTVSSITSPQGANNDTTAFTVGTNSKLILSTYTTTANPFQTTRDVVYADDGGTSCADKTLFFQQRIAYFITTAGGQDNLWRRVLQVPSQTACAGTSPWQETSCQTGQTGSPCQTEDILLLKANSITMDVAYLVDAASSTEATTPQPDSRAVRVTLTAQRGAAGRTYNFTGTITVDNINF